ncbi:MAG: urease accessory protein UreF [Alphaproteobacteria bacterium]|nr:urease accessory protein UreF [Alphaproteobacteria bacterium]
MITDSTDIATTIEGRAGLYRLLSWLSPAYPVGAFSYSHGIEHAVEAGLVRDRATLADWITGILRQGAGVSDGALLAAAWRAARASDVAALCDLSAFSAAWRGGSELALESAGQGRAFLAITRSAWPDPFLDELADAIGEAEIGYPVAFGLAAGRAGIPLQAALVGYFQAFAANLVSAAVRLIPLGQTDGQRCQRALLAEVVAIADQALAADLAEAGTAAPMVDWTSMRHETQYTRLFRS